MVMEDLRGKTGGMGRMAPTPSLPPPACPSRFAGALPALANQRPPFPTKPPARLLALDEGHDHGPRLVIEGHRRAFVCLSVVAGEELATRECSVGRNHGAQIVRNFRQSERRRLSTGTMPNAQLRLLRKRCHRQ